MQSWVNIHFFPELWYSLAMSLQLSDIEKLAELSRLTLTEEEKKQYLQDFSSILKYVSEISEVKSGEVQESPTLTNVMRDDVVEHAAGTYTVALLAAAPATENGYYKVKQVF